MAHNRHIVSLPSFLSLLHSVFTYTTHCSSGIGNDLALAALQRGDKVLATARSKSVNSTAMQKLKEAGKENVAVLELDVTSGLDTLKLVAREAVNVWGRVDVVVNNAGE